MEIVAQPGRIRRVTDSSYLVRSHSGIAWRQVHWENGRWVCDCQEDPASHEACEHVYAVTFLLKLPSILLMNLNHDLLTCPRCDAEPEKVVSVGMRRNKSGATRRFKCKRCGYKFSDRTGFAKMRSDPLMIVAALDLYFKGLSVRQVQHHLSSLYGCEASHMSTYRWIRKYVKLLEEFAKQLTPSVGERWHADDMSVKVEGRPHYLWNIMDRRTRFLLVSKLTTGRGTDDAYEALKMAIERAGKKAERLVSDGLKSYGRAAGRLGIQGHISKVRFTDPANNNMIERLNGSLRPRYDLTLGLGGLASARDIANGLALYYNFIRPHMALDGRTPSEEAGLRMGGRNRWFALIEEASKRKPPEAT